MNAEAKTTILSIPQPMLRQWLMVPLEVHLNFVGKNVAPVPECMFPNPYGQRYVFHFFIRHWQLRLADNGVSLQIYLISFHWYIRSYIKVLLHCLCSSEGFYRFCLWRMLDYPGINHCYIFRAKKKFSAIVCFINDSPSVNKKIIIRKRSFYQFHIFNKISWQ